MSIIAKSWRDYKVAESPITVKLLSSKFLNKKTVCEAKNWEAWLTTEPDKHVWWFLRITEAYASRILRANAEMLGKQVTLRTRANSFRDKPSEELYLASMAWAAWQTEMKTLVNEKKLADLNSMFSRGRHPQLKLNKQPLVSYGASLFAVIASWQVLRRADCQRYEGGLPRFQGKGFSNLIPVGSDIANIK